MATQKRNALGRGLDALLSMDDVKTEGSSSISEIELAKITVTPISHAANSIKRHYRNWLFHCGNRYHTAYHSTQTLGR